jgi:hypothetical protein
MRRYEIASLPTCFLHVILCFRSCLRHQSSRKNARGSEC